MRTEKDSMGEMQVPESALYGASTQRAVLNFPISSLRFSEHFIKALGHIKKAAALTNHELANLDEKTTKAITQAADELIEGTLYDQFVVDIFQTGSGTSTNMNANEVLANRAIQILGGVLGDKAMVHPNDHVNMSQSSNDVIPTAIHISSALAYTQNLRPAGEKLAASLEAKAKQFERVIKSGRTHLQDATPVTLGQEFLGYAAQIRFSIERLDQSLSGLTELALGGTAVGTGLNTHPNFAEKAIARISEQTGVNFSEARNHFEAQGSRDAAVAFSGQLRTMACAMMKIANDVRWLSSGPRCGLGEIRLPEIQPGSSIMPAKVNPVICESVMMVAAQVIGNDAAITVGGQHGNFELNVMLPVIGYNLLQSIELLASSCENFVEKCVDGIEANEERCEEYAEKSLATCTSLAPVIGYDKAADIAKRALKENKTVREVATEQGVLDPEELSKVLDLFRMTAPSE